MALPVARVLAAPLLGIDPLGGLGRLLAAHPWLARHLLLPLDVARSWSQALTLLGAALAIACGLACFRLARAVGLGATALAPALAVEFSPGLPATGLDPAGLASLAMPLLVLATLRARAPLRAVRRLAGAVLLFGLAGRADALAAGLALAAALAVPAIAAVPDAPGRRRVVGRLVAGVLVGLALAYPLQALDLVLAPPARLGALAASLDLAARPWIGGGTGLPAGPGALAILAPSIGLAAAAWPSPARRSGRGATAILLAALAIGVGLAACGVEAAFPAPLATAAMLGAASALRLGGPADPLDRRGRAARAGAAVLAGLALAALAARSGTPPADLAIVAALAAAPALLLLAAGRIAGGLALLAAVVAACLPWVHPG